MSTTAAAHTDLFEIKPTSTSIAVHGAMTYATVTLIDQQVRPLIEAWQADSTMAIDLASVDRSDSAGLTVLLAWLRLAQQRHISCHITNMPSELRQLCQLYHLTPILNPA